MVIGAGSLYERVRDGEAMPKAFAEEGRVKDMWYAVQVYTGAEENTCIQCERILRSLPKEKGRPPLADECCVLYHEEQRKFKGRWRTCRRPLFPGYLFISTEHPLEVFAELRHVVGLTNLLHIEEEIVPLTQKESDFLMQIAGDDRIVEMSEGIIEGNHIKVLSGPLVGMEGTIRKVDRHKRKAYIEVEMFGRKQQIQVGLEIAMKKLETEDCADR